MNSRFQELDLPLRRKFPSAFFGKHETALSPLLSTKREGLQDLNRALRKSSHAY
jgi:hypothetical protein